MPVMRVEGERTYTMRRPLKTPTTATLSPAAAADVAAASFATAREALTFAGAALLDFARRSSGRVRRGEVFRHPVRALSSFVTEVIWIEPRRSDGAHTYTVDVKLSRTNR